MLQTPIKPYNNTETHSLKKKLPQLKPVEETSGSGDEDEEGVGGRPRSPASSSPQAHHSSSDCGSDLEELLAKSFPGEDLSSLLTRAMGKGVCEKWSVMVEAMWGVCDSGDHMGWKQCVWEGGGEV